MLIDFKRELEFLLDEKIEEIGVVCKKLLESDLSCIIILYETFCRGEWNEKRRVRSHTISDCNILAENISQKIRAA